MKLFLDSAELSEIKEIVNLGMCDGVTTNPSLIAKSGRDFKSVLSEIVEIVPGPVSAEVISTNYQEMLKEAETLYKIASNIVIKLPLTQEGLKCCKSLSNKGIKTNVTLCFSANQALLAAKAGATFISPFVGRLFDIGEDGIALLKNIRTLYDAYGFETKILAASIRNVEQVSQAAMVGSDASTIPYQVFSELYFHALTDKGLQKFLDDWNASGQARI
jgi:transaldolase